LEVAMKSIAFFLVVVILFASAGLPHTVIAANPPEEAREATRTTRVQPQVHKGDGWAIAAPGEWAAFNGLQPPAQLYLLGDGCEGIPIMDGTLGVLKAGLMVEAFPDRKGTLKEHVEKDM